MSKSISINIKFFLITFLLLVARGCDFYSTSLWFFDNPSGEQNLLYRLAGFGWTGLILSNSILVALIMYCFYYYTFKYTVDQLSTMPKGLTDYISKRYFNQAGLFYQVFYKTPKNKNTFLGHIGYVLIRVAIFGSLLATIHNLGQYYNLPAYNTFRELVGRPLYVIYGLIGASFVCFQYLLWNKEFQSAKLYFDSVNPNTK